MFTWIKSFSGAIVLTVISLLVFLGRTFIDYYFVYSEFGLGIDMVGITILFNLILFGGWIWALLSAVQGTRRALFAVFGFNLFFLLVIAVGTLVSYCPSPCETGWPLGEIGSWASFAAGLLATIALGNQIWRGDQQESTKIVRKEAI
jgi:hypothetical protein